ncbi:MAG: TonB-dependent receptor [Halioglobus sp.]|nr:TonB-dependent receptor [Halioglobus sp.]
MKNTWYLFLLVTLGLTGLSFSLPTQAENLVLEEVVVTARKRAESLQEVPVAVTAFSTETMESLGIKNMHDIDGLVPGLNLGAGNGVKGDGNAYIRGVGQRETRVTLDSGVGIYLDEVYIARASGALLDAVETESIQVLRGPQGTLFGKNTTGGAILYTSIKPSAEFSGTAKGTYGNLERKDASLAIDIPLIEDTLLSRLSLATVNRDGYIENNLDGTQYTDEDRNIIVGQLRWLPTDSLLVDLNLNHTKVDQKPIGQKCIWLGDELTAAGFPNPGTLEGIYNALSPISVEEYCNRSGEDLPIDEFQSEQNSRSKIFYQGVYKVETSMAAATLSWEVNDRLQFKSITAYRNTEQTADEDLDGMAAVIIGRLSPENNDTDQYTQEFQFIGDALDDRLRYTLGLYGFYEETNDDWLQDFAGYIETTTATNSILLARSNLTERETENVAYAGFGQFDYNLSDNFIMTAGVRYTWEERKTKYRESKIYLPSIGQGDYLGELDTIYAANVLHPFSKPGGTSVTTWQYGFDPDGPGGEPFEVGAFGELKDDRNDEDWSPMASIKYIATDSVLDALHMDDAMTYLTYSSGFRSGGVAVGNGDFDSDGIIDLENFKPEFVDMLEWGFKIDAFDRRLRTNVAIFYQQYKDIQLTTTRPDPTFGIPLPSIENAGKAEMKGVEIEYTFLPTDNLRFMGSIAYLDAEFKEYLSEIPDPNGGGQIIIDRSDEPMPRAPKWTTYIAVDYNINTGAMGTITPTFLVRYIDEIYGGFDRPSFYVSDEVSIPAGTFYETRLIWSLPDERTTITAWVKNLTDIDDHEQGGVPTVGVARTTTQGYALPRTYGIDLTYRFGGG